MKDDISEYLLSDFTFPRQNKTQDYGIMGKSYKVELEDGGKGLFCL